jgi:hypothetical protein
MISRAAASYRPKEAMHKPRDAPANGLLQINLDILPHLGLKQQIYNECGLRRLDIGCAVTNYKTAFALHRPVLHQVKDMPGFGFRQWSSR